MIHWYDFLLRLGVAICARALIGLERQWHSRGAGLPTNTLVAAGAAIFVLISHMAPKGALNVLAPARRSCEPAAVQGRGAGMALRVRPAPLG
jgi:putative Mg2+ transporter-C (MgtC) family protein